MKLLRRVLYWEAAILTLAGAAVAIFPRLVLVDLFGQVRYPDYAWVRIAGIQGIGFAMLAVLVAQRIEDLWWFCWAYVLVSVAIAVVVTLNAIAGLPERSSAVLWWLLAAESVVVAAALLWGMAQAGRERPADLG